LSREQPVHGCAFALLRQLEPRLCREPCCASAQGPRTIDRVIRPSTGRAAASAPGSAPGAGRALLARGHVGARKVP